MGFWDLVKITIGSLFLLIIGILFLASDYAGENKTTDNIAKIVIVLSIGGLIPITSKIINKVRQIREINAAKKHSIIKQLEKDNQDRINHEVRALLKQRDKIIRDLEQCKLSQSKSDTLEQTNTSERD